MKKILFILFIILPINVSAIETSARSAILMDTDTNRILYSKNIDEQRSVASISKIMTAVIAIESGKLDDIVIVGDEIDKSYGSGIYIEKGEEISLRDLVYGLMLRSGNDASYAIAHYVAGDKFVELMNKKAKEIGMRNTIFNNPNGLDEEDGNYSTAYDMALLTSYAVKLDEYKKIVGTRQHIVKTNKKTYLWINKNKLLFSYQYITGGKTGFTQKAKRTLVTTASKDDLNLVVVTLNDGNDFLDHKRLFEYGFDNYYKQQILKQGKLNIHDKLYYGKYDLFIDKDYSCILDNNDKVYLEIDLSEVPVEGKTGEVRVIVNNKAIYKEDINAKKIVKKRKTIFERLKIW